MPAAGQPTSWQEAVLAPLACPGRSLDSEAGLGQTLVLYFGTLLNCSGLVVGRTASRVASVCFTVACLHHPQVCAPSRPRSRVSYVASVCFTVACLHHPQRTFDFVAWDFSSTCACCSLTPLTASKR